MNYLFLIAAIAFEIAATMTLKATEKFTKLGPSVIVIVCVCVSLYLYSVCVERMNVAVVYTIWSGVGIATVAILGWVIYGQKLDAPAIVGILLIGAGCIVMNGFSKTVDVPETKTVVVDK